MDPVIVLFMLFTLLVVGAMGLVCWAALSYRSPTVLVIEDEPDDDDEGPGELDPPEEPDGRGPGRIVDWESFDRERAEWHLTRST